MFPFFKSFFFKKINAIVKLTCVNEEKHLFNTLYAGLDLQLGVVGPGLGPPKFKTPQNPYIQFCVTHNEVRNTFNLLI